MSLDDKQINLPHERCNYITPNIILGACPMTETLLKMEHFGVKIFIDLREQTNYNTKCQKYHFPILGGKPPSKKQALEIFKIIQENSDKLIYIHCNGGHGRAGTIGAYILGKLYGFDASEVVKKIQLARETRIDKTRNFIPTPEMNVQIKFLVKELGLKNGNIVPDRSNVEWLKLINNI
jgi:hypothetical protein